MKWNETGLRFARPMRWIVALFLGAKVVPVEVAGIKAGNKTYGHRVMGGGKSHHRERFQDLQQSGLNGTG